MDIEDYQEKDISGKILYLASLFKGIKDHLKILNEMDELTGVYLVWKNRKIREIGF